MERQTERQTKRQKKFKKIKIKRWRETGMERETERDQRNSYTKRQIQKEKTIRKVKNNMTETEIETY